MQKVILSIFAIVAVASAGGIQGSYQTQYTQHSHAVVAHAAPIVHAAPAVVHHAPVVHIASAPIIRSAPVAIPTYYRAAVPTAYASTYSYRAPAAKILKTVAVAQPIVYAQPRPIVRTVAVAPAYASTFGYRAPAIVHHGAYFH